MYRVLFFSIIVLFIATGCKPAVKDEAQTVNPPAKSLPDSIKTPTLTRLWDTEAKLITAESVFYDTTGNILYVSCIGGVPPDKKDGDGFIAKVGLDGKIITLKWVTGLNAPKGMGKIGNTLYVTDIDKLVAVDIKTGKISNSWKVSGASFLNDIATSTDDVVYVSDSNTGTIYQMAKGKVTVMLGDTSIHYINGLYIDGEKLLVASDGKTLAVNIASHNIKKIAEGIPAGDGIKTYGDGIIQSSWLGEIYYIDPTGKTKKILDTKGFKLNSADIEVVENKNLLFVPTFFGNRVTAYSIK